MVSVAPLVTPAHAQVTITALDWTTTTAQMGAVIINHVRVTIGTYTAQLTATYCGTARDTTSFAVTSGTDEITTIAIPVTIRGLSPQLSVSMTIDGKDVGTIPGGGTKTFNVDKNTAHTFEVEAQVKANCATYEGTDVCTRFSNSNNVWTLDVISTQNCQEIPVCYDTYYYCDAYGYCYYEPYCTYEQQCWTPVELSGKGHTFAYGVEQQVMINDVHGQNTDTWQKLGANVTLSANEFVVTRKDSNVKERDVFVRWLVNGAPMEGRTLTLKADKPLFIKAEYQTETEYRLTVHNSPSGAGQISLNPSSPDYWYSAGASIQVTAVVVASSSVFSHWELDGTDVGTAQPYSLVMDSPHQLAAVFSVATITTTETATSFITEATSSIEVVPSTSTVVVTEATTNKAIVETSRNASNQSTGNQLPPFSPQFVAIVLVVALSVAALVAIGISRLRRIHAVPPSPRICSSCGFENPPYTRAFCVNCGSPLEER